MDAATGIELERLEPGQITSAGIDWLSGHGSWVGDRVVTGGMSAEGTPGLVLLRIGPEEVSVERCRRDFTVPTGIPVKSAISSTES